MCALMLEEYCENKECIRLPKKPLWTMFTCFPLKIKTPGKFNSCDGYVCQNVPWISASTYMVSSDTIPC